jgi:hypothetical protein
MITRRRRRRQPFTLPEIVLPGIRLCNFLTGNKNEIIDEGQE